MVERSHCMQHIIREQFPILAQQVNGEVLVYLDNAASTQKPQAVLDAMMQFYQNDYANIHRGVHTLAERATQHYEEARRIVANFIHAKPEEVIFTSGTTAGINFIARSLVEPMLQAGDQILLTRVEHHSNLVPWQALAQRVQAELVFAPLNEQFQVDMTALSTNRIKVLAIHHISNVLGVEQPIQELVKWAKEHGILVIVDGAQATAHKKIDLQLLDADAYCFSGHKLYGPTGIGVCYLNAKWHDICEPFNYGGEMIYSVGDTNSSYKNAPWKFEGGTPPIVQASGLATAIQFVESIGFDKIVAHEQALTEHLAEGLRQIEGVTVYGAGNGIVSFNIEGVHPHDAATGYDMEGIAIRAGHHCAQPLMRQLGVPATLRASIAIYNTLDEMDKMIQATYKVKEFFTQWQLGN